MQTKWCLVKVSDGNRGALGKKKVYELSIDGNSFTAVWGMAEKPVRQSEVKNYRDDFYARQMAFMKVQEKLNKGYKLAYAV